MYTAHRRNIISLSERLLKYLLCLDCKRFLAPLVHPASEGGGEELIAAAAFIVKREGERESCEIMPRSKALFMPSSNKIRNG